MNDYDDYDPHETSYEHHADRDLGEELLAAVSPDTSLQSNTFHNQHPRHTGRDNAETTLGRSTDEQQRLMEGLSLAYELGEPDIHADSFPQSTSFGSATGAGAAPNGLVANAGDTLGDELAGAGGSLGEELAGAFEHSQYDHPPPRESLIEREGEQTEIRAAQEQAKYEATAASLAESIRTTEEFLGRLRQAAGTQANSATAIAPVATTDTTTLTTTPSSDETNRVESIGNSIGLTLRDHAKQREAQVRELQEMVRALSRDDINYRIAIAQALKGVPDEGDDSFNSSNEDDPTRYSPGEPSAEAKARLSQPLDLDDLASPHSDLLRQSSRANEHQQQTKLSQTRRGDAHDPTNRESLGHLVEEDEDGEEATGPGSQHSFHHGSSSSFARSSGPGARASSSSSTILPPAPSRRAPLVDHLQHFQAVTGSLVSSLQILNEHSQMTAAGSREASKKLRVLTKAVGEWQRESQIAEESRCRIENASEGHGSSTRTDRASQRAEREMQSICETLDRATAQAEKLLTPVPLAA